MATAFVSISQELPTADGVKIASDWKPFTATTKVGNDGSYVFASVPPGKYGICAQAPGTDLVNGCSWGLDVVRASVDASVLTLMSTLRMQKGHRLKIRLDDPDGLLRKQEGRASNAFVTVGVWGPGGFYQPATELSSDTKGRDLEIVAPFDAALRVGATSPYFTIVGEDGKELAGVAATKDATTPTGSVGIVHRFTVRGLKSN